MTMLRKVLAAAIAAFSSGCQAPYILRAAFEEGKILLARDDIRVGIREGRFTPEEEEKLRWVLEAREYAATIGLDPKCSFTKYAPVGRDVLSWILMGAKRTSFEMAGWWFPVVGTVPYKGFFEREDADNAQRALEAEGFETWVRPTDAFSTLGWFNDPILSTTLRHSISRLINTVIHESVHTTVWVRGHVPFNESMAHAIGYLGAETFLRKKLEGCDTDECRRTVKQLLEEHVSYWAFEQELAKLIDKLYAELGELYRRGAPLEEVLEERAKIFTRIVVPFDAKYPKRSILLAVNNAEIMQLKVYLTELALFVDLRAGSDSFETFVTTLLTIARQAEAKGVDPFALLRERGVSQ